MTAIPFTVPVAEQRFVLEHIACIADLAATERFASAESDMVDAILEGAAALAEGEWAPTNRTGDTSHPQWQDGDVIMPPGFRAAYQAYIDGGWGTITWPEKWGGQGLPNVVGLAVMESLGTANMGFGLCPMLTSGAVEALASHGSVELQSQYLEKLVTGEWTGTMNLTEPQAGSDVGSLRSKAAPAGDGSWRIKGTKIFITFGEHDLTDNIVHLVLARTPDGAPGTRGISLFLVPKIRADGSRNDVRCASIEHKLGIHSSPTCVMTFGDNDDCHGWLIGPEFGGMKAMFTMMNNARLNVGLQGVQIAERATQQALDYAKNRVQSPRANGSSSKFVPIIEHPDVRRMVMRMKAQTQAIRALVYAAAAEVDCAHLGLAGAKQRLDLLTPLAKSHATDVGCEVASLGVQVHGGTGYIEGTGAAQHYRDARIAPIYEGTNGIQAADLVGRKLIGDGGAGIMALIADVRSETRNAHLLALTDRLADVTAHLLAADTDDRLAASAPYLTMLSVMTCGWLMERQAFKAIELISAEKECVPFMNEKVACANWYLTHILPEMAGLAYSVMAGAQYLYDVPSELW